MDQFELSCKTATEKEYEVRFMGATTIGVTSVLYIEIIGHSIAELVPVFVNPQETSYLRGLVAGEVQKEFHNYINLIEAICLAETGNVRIALTAPIDGSAAE